jgi:FlaA1/EpsC-like NDP-sugar epimerase
LESHETQPPSALLAPALPATHTITGLAAFMARELAPGKETPIHFTGLRAGDKETELLWGADEQARHAGEGAWMRIETSLLPAQELQRALDRLRAAHDSRDLPAALAELQQLVPAYTPSAAMRSLAAARVCA